ncbi:beta strand repeat-containing protein, partial [Maribacter litoralis]|uniref:beta strand repeat-containing protein n=1 Tax=Maribacter litoralis TaxID=2059726 RepID=UPI00132F6842
YTVATEISAAAGNNLTVETDGLFAADDQIAAEVEVTPAGNITTNDVQSALEELDGIITSSELTTTVVEGDGVDVTSTVVGNNTEYTVATEISAAAGNNLTVETDGLFAADDQNAAEVNLVTPLDVDGDTVNETTVEEAIADIVANSSDNQDLTGANLNGSNQLQIDIQRGASTTVDLSSLSETVIAGSGAVTVNDDGNGNYTINSIDSDEDETNELAVLAPGPPSTNGVNSGDTYVDTDNGQLYAWDGTTWQQVGGSAAPDADPNPENELSDISLTNTTLELTNPAPGATGVDLNNMFATDMELSDAITASEALDLDKDNQNELQDLEEVLLRDPSAGGIVITDVGTPVNANDAVNKAYVDNLADDDVSVTNTAAGNRIATISEPGITAVDINESVTTLSDADADGIFEYVSENNTTTSFDGTDDQNATEVDLATPLDVDGDLVNETTVEEAIADLANNSSDNQDLELNSGTNILSLTNDSSTVDLTPYVNDDTNEIQDLELTGDNLTLTNDPTATVIDLSDYRETVVGTGDISVTNNGSGEYTVDYVDGDKSDTNEIQNAAEVDLVTPIDVDGDLVNETTVEEAIADLANNSSDNQNLTGATLNGSNQLQIDIERGSSTNVDLSSLSETVTAGTGAIRVDDDGNGNYTVNSTDSDEDETNEIQDLTYDPATQILNITDNPTATDIDLSGLVNTDEQALQLIGDNLTLTNDPTATAIDLSDYRETVSGSGDISVTNDGNGNYTVDYVDGDNDSTNELTQRGNGGPTGTSTEGTTYVDTDSGQLYVYDSGAWQPVGGSAIPGDASDANELITSFGVVGPNLRITEAGTDFDVPLSDIGTDSQDLSLTGDNLTLTNDPTATAIDLSDYRETVSGTGDISVTDDGNGNYTVDYVDGDKSDTNEIQDLSYDPSTQTLNITNNPSATDIDLSALVSSDNQNIENLAFSGTTLTVGIEDGTSQTVSLAELADNQSITGSGLSGNTLTIGIEDGSSETVDLSPLADNQSISGSVLSGNTLTIGIEDGSSETVDLSSLNETVVGTNDITVTDDGNGNYTVDYIDGDNDDENEIELPEGGNNGQVLSTDGSGTYTWVDPDSGPAGTNGADGNGIASTTDNGDGTFTLTYDDGTTFTTSDLTGPQGTPGN